MQPLLWALAVAVHAALAGPALALLRHGNPELLEPGQGLHQAASTLNQDLGLRVLPLLETLVGSQENVTLVDVGACDGDFGAGVGPYKSVSIDPVQSTLFKPNVRAVLVEPNPPVFAKLEERVHASFGDSERIQLVQAAVSANTSGSVPFYVVSPKFMKDHPEAPHWLAQEISSLNRQHVLQHHTASGLSEGQFARYVEEISVPSRKPAELLAVAGLAPEGVDVLKVDAEGYDADIVGAFMDVPSFSPKIIIFEALHLPKRNLRSLVGRLEREGYQTDCNKIICPMNVLAFQRAYFP